MNVLSVFKVKILNGAMVPCVIVRLWTLSSIFPKTNSECRQSGTSAQQKSDSCRKAKLSQQTS